MNEKAADANLRNGSRLPFLCSFHPEALTLVGAFAMIRETAEIRRSIR